MAPSRNKNTNKKRNGNGNGNKTRNGNRRRARVTTRQNFRTGSNGLSNQGAIRRPMVQKCFIESGSDFLGPLSVRANPTSAAERVLLSNSISPSAFPGTRLTQLSNLWERYRFRKFRLRWVPAVPKTLACQLIIYQDTDPLDDPTIITNADALVRQATAQAGSQQFNFINGMAIELAKRSDDQLYYTGNDRQNERFNRQGNFYVIQVTNPLNFNGIPLSEDILAGSLYVDWICEFQIAQINPSAVLSALAPIPSIFSGHIDVFSAGPLVPDQVVGVINLTVPTYLSSRDLNFTRTGVNNDIVLLVNAVEIGSSASASPLNNLSQSLPTLFPAGSFQVRYTTTGSPTFLSPISLNWETPTDNTPIFA